MREKKCAAAMAGLLMIVAAGCSGPTTTPVSREDATARVGHLLYSENIIADPEVSARVRESIAAVDRDGVPADSILPQLHAWIERWVRNNPDRVQRARLMPRIPAAQRPSE